MKKLLALVLAAVMLFTLMSFAAAEEEPFVLTVMLPQMESTYEFQYENNPVLKAIEEASGVRLDIRFVANSGYGDMTTLTLADPSSMPMVMVVTGPRDSNIIQAARDGAFWDITDYVQDAENYPMLAEGPEGIYNNISVDGRVYGIFRGRAYPRAGIYYRSDIAAQQGITKKPETIDELTELAMALAKVSPDTYALNMCKYVAGTINVITVAMGAPQTWGIDENGDVYPAHKSPAYLEGLTWLRNLYAAGGINPDFMNIESGDWDKQERTGVCFMRFDCMDNGYRQQEWFEKNEGVTELIFDIIPGLKKADGSITIWPQNPGFSGEIVICKPAVSEEDLPKVLKFLDWTNTPEGQTLISCGVEGVTYWMHSDGFRYTTPENDESITAESTKPLNGSMNQLGTNVGGDKTPALAQTDLRALYAQYNIDYAQYAVSDPCYPLISETAVMYGATLSQMLEDAAVQYIAGIIDEDGLRAVWQQWADEGGDMMTEEYNEAYHAAN